MVDRFVFETESVPAANLAELPHALDSLGVSVFNQADVEDTMARQAQIFTKEETAKELISAQTSLASLQQDISILTEALSTTDKELNLLLAAKSAPAQELSTLKIRKQEQVKELQDLRAKELKLVHAVSRVSRRIDLEDQITKANELIYSEKEQKVTAGEMTPFGTVMEAPTRTNLRLYRQQHLSSILASTGKSVSRIKMRDVQKSTKKRNNGSIHTDAYAMAEKRFKEETEELQQLDQDPDDTRDTFSSMDGTLQTDSLDVLEAPASGIPLEQPDEKEGSSSKCRGGCGFFGSNADGYCSKCATQTPDANRRESLETSEPVCCDAKRGAKKNCLQCGACWHSACDRHQRGRALTESDDFICLICKSEVQDQSFAGVAGHGVDATPAPPTSKPKRSKRLASRHDESDNDEDFNAERGKESMDPDSEDSIEEVKHGPVSSKYVDVAQDSDDNLLVTFETRVARWKLWLQSNDSDYCNEDWVPLSPLDEDGQLTNNGLLVPNIIWSHLYHYQRISVQWLWELHQQGVGGIIGDEMGLGKTIQMISFLAALHFGDCARDECSHPA